MTVLPLLSNEHALKSGTFGVPGLVLLGRGTTLHKSGTSRGIRDGWQPYTTMTHELEYCQLTISRISYQCRDGTTMDFLILTLRLTLRLPGLQSSTLCSCD